MKRIAKLIVLSGVLLVTVALVKPGFTVNAISTTGINEIETKFSTASKPNDKLNDLDIYEEADVKVQKNGWTKVGSTWSYYSNGKMHKGWLELQGNWYYLDSQGILLQDGTFQIGNDQKGFYSFNKSGVMRKGWISGAHGWQYASQSGRLLSDEWLKSGGKWYYFLTDGNAAKERSVSIGVDEYYFDELSIMVSNGWQSVYSYTGNRYVYADSNGKLLRSQWKKSGRNWYYLDYSGYTVHDSVAEIDDVIYGFDKNSVLSEKPGYYYPYIIKNDKSVAKEEWLLVNKKWYYADSQGRLETDKIELNGNLYVFGDGGAMLSDTRTYARSKKGGYTYLSKNGVALKNQWIKEGEEWLYVNSEGRTYNLEFGLINGNEYYFDENSFMVKGNDILIDGRYHHFSSSGVRLSSTEKTLNDSSTNSVGTWKKIGYEYYYYRGNELVTGWVNHNGDWYFLEDHTGIMMSDSILYAGNNVYSFTKSGRLITGWGISNGSWFYGNDSGAVIRENWKKSGNDWYYFMYNGAAEKSGSVSVDNKVYSFDHKSKMITNAWAKLISAEHINSYAYHDKNGVAISNQWKKSGNDWYYFANSYSISGDIHLINGKRYLFDDNSKLVEKPGIYNFTYNTFIMKDNGLPAFNEWIKLDGKWYYSDHGYILKEGEYTIGNKLYSFDKYGVLNVSKWSKLSSRYGDTTVYYSLSDKNGVLETNKWAKSGTKWFYLDEEGKTVTSSFKLISNKLYYFNSKGEMASGRNQYIDEKYHHFTVSGVWETSSTIKR